MKLLGFVFVVYSSLCAAALDREAFTFTQYDLKVRVEPEQQRLGVRGKISLRNDSSSPQRSLLLQISSSLNWSSIQFEGKPVEFVSQIYTSDIDHTGALSEAIVVLPQAVAPKQTVDLEIGYEGVIPQDATRLTRIGMAADAAKHSDWDEIARSFTAVRGVGYVEWYPVAMDAVSLSDGDAVPESVAKWKQREAKAEMKVTFTGSGSGDMTKLLCNGPGNLISYPQAGASYQEQNQCNYLLRQVPLFIIGNFDLLDRTAVSIFYLQEHKTGAENYAAAVEELLPLTSKWFGDHRDGTESKAELVDLVDSQAATYKTGNLLLMPLTGSDTKLLFSAAEQLTTALFPSPRLWIHDGLASYAQARLIQEKESRQAAIDYLQAHRPTLVDLEKVSGRPNGEDDSLIGSVDAFRVQTKSMYVWWMLRDMIGEGALETALHHYKAADDNDSKYMQRLIDSEAHRDVQWFFDDWVYHDHGLPDFRVASVYPSRLPSGGYMVTVTVENLGAAGAEIPVTLHMQGSEASDRLIVPAKSKASVRIQTPTLPLEVILNDGGVPESDTSNDVYKIESTNQ